LRTAIVGFPGETDEHFEHLVQFVRHEFDHVACLHRRRKPLLTNCRIICPKTSWTRDGTPNGSPAADFPEEKSSRSGQVVDVLIEQENPETGELMVALLGFRRRWMV